MTIPGALPMGMTVESVHSGGHPRSRNELMANYLLVMGFMERRGLGWPIMRRAMRNFNGTVPELVQDADGKSERVTLHFDGGGIRERWRETCEADPVFRVDGFIPNRSRRVLCNPDNQMHLAEEAREFMGAGPPALAR